MYEKFTNQDYEDLNDKDFRSIRHRKKEVYRDSTDEIIEELENHLGSEKDKRHQIDTFGHISLHDDTLEEHLALPKDSMISKLVEQCKYILDST